MILYAPGAYDVVIANFATPEIHELTLICYVDDFIRAYAKSIRQSYVSMTIDM